MCLFDANGDCARWCESYIETTTIRLIYDFVSKGGVYAMKSLFCFNLCCLFYPPIKIIGRFFMCSN